MSGTALPEPLPDPPAELSFDLTPALDTPRVSAPVPPPPTLPAGWYPDPDNHSGFRYGGAPSLRYFDGVVWTDNRAPMQRRPQHHQQQAPAAPIIVNQQFAPQSPVVVYRGGSNHGLHLLLSVLTCGAWLPVWLIITVLTSSPPLRTGIPRAASLSR